MPALDTGTPGQRMVRRVQRIGTSETLGTIGPPGNANPRRPGLRELIDVMCDTRRIRP
jgi:hypothetical protein